MRTLLSIALVGLVGLSSVNGQAAPADERVVGTWSGPASCQHGNGETFTMSITRDARGQLTGTMDWALSSSDGRRGPGLPLDTLVVDGSTIAATAKRDRRTARLDAVVDGDTITGTWTTSGADDTWTFKGTRQAPRER